MQLFYNPELKPDSSSCYFDKTESGHLHRVLRKKEGDRLWVTNGRGILFEVALTLADKNKAAGKIINYQRDPRKNNHLHIAIAPTKKNSRFENFLEKATEIGIDEITPLICKNSERKKVKLNRFERILEAGMKQSLRWRLPLLNEPVTFQDFSANSEYESRFIAHCEEKQQERLENLLKPAHKVLILIGPEGDFSPDEIQMALANNFIPASLGSHRLRTETAGIVSCQIAASVNGGGL